VFPLLFDGVDTLKVSLDGCSLLFLKTLPLLTLVLFVVLFRLLGLDKTLLFTALSGFPLLD
jgi:hypothetical protein